jgi:hypothetical protein
MPEPRKNQKQIASKYKGNLRYFRHMHPLRLARWIAGLICMVIALIVGGYYVWVWELTPKAVVDANKKEAAPDDLSGQRKFEWLNSSGPISQAHSRYANDCEKCHDPSLKTNLAEPKVVKASLDGKCVVCHNTPSYNFHQTNVVGGQSCTDCHHEHITAGPMQPVADSNCINCHGNAGTMKQSADLSQQASGTTADGKKIYFAASQPFRMDNQLVYYPEPRPAEGYTKVIHAFADDHPEFQFKRDNLSDPDTLKFGHQFHLSERVRTADGKQLTCEYCHKIDGNGTYMQPISYEKSCQECHQLQMDVAQPNFLIPHPGKGDNNQNAVRDFLHNLPTEYHNFAIQTLHKQGGEVDAYVAGAMKRVRQRIRSGEDLEQEVFYSNIDKVDLEGEKHAIYYGGPAPTQSPMRSVFQGCVVCHEVKTVAGQNVVTPPVIPDRWEAHANFSHAAHQGIMPDCRQCHEMAATSEKTSDILLPDKASCVKCHSPAGNVASTCTTCHDFHNESPAHQMAAGTPMKKLLLGGSLFGQK